MKGKRKWILGGFFALTMCLTMASPLLVLAEEGTSSGELKISIISDPHIYSNTLGTSGALFEEYISKNAKMITESELILDATLAKIKADTSNIVLIPGDLTKDGELVNHELMARKLKELEATGKKVFVINGNHDITNAKAYQYSETGTTSTPTTSTDAFKEIYKDFGYGEAISQDEDSLSYVVEPIPGYRIIAIDSCIYNDDTYTPSSKTAGEIQATTLTWIKAQIKDAKLQGKEIVGMMHHGLVSHNSVQPIYYPDFLVKNYASIAKQLADAGLSVMFTGHFHAQDISVATSALGNKIYDVQTGSLISYPVPIRTVTLKDHVLTVTSQRVDEVPGLDLKGEANFKSYALKLFKAGMIIQAKSIVAKAFTKEALNTLSATVILDSFVPETSETQGTPNTVKDYLADCMIAFYTGDEAPNAIMNEITNSFLNSADPNYQLIGKIAASYSADNGGDVTNPITDNNVTIALLPVIVAPVETIVPTVKAPVKATVTATVKATVSSSTTLLNKVSVLPSKNTLYYGGNTGKTKSIKITVPKGTKYTVRYKSSKKSIATVSKTGKISAKKTGSATITTTVTINNKSKSFRTKVTVKKAHISITKSKASMKQNNKFTFKATAYGYSGKLVWLTTKKKIVDISTKTGKATAKTKGTDYIIVKGGKISKKIKVVVK